MKKLESLFFAILFPFAYFFVQWLVLTFARQILGAPHSVWVLIAAALLTLAALVPLLKKPALAKAVQFRPMPRLWQIFRLAAAGLGLNVVLMGLLWFAPFPEAWFSEHGEAIGRLSGAGLLAQSLLVLVLAPVLEEILFRGLSFSFLRKGFSPVQAVVLQAVLFGAFHGTNLQRVYAFAAGLVLGLVVLRFGTVTAAIIVHIVFNGVSLALAPALNSIPAVLWPVVLPLAAVAVAVPIATADRGCKSAPRR